MLTRFSALVKAIRGATRVFAVGAHVSKVLCRSLRTVDLQARRSPMLTFFGIRKILVQAFAAQSSELQLRIDSLKLHLLETSPT